MLVMIMVMTVTCFANRLTKLQTKESRDFRGTLKSTGQNKFALKDEDDSVSFLSF